MLLSENITFIFGFPICQISQSPRLSSIWINLGTDLYFIFEFPARASHVRLKNILKSPPTIMFLQCKSVIPCKSLQKVDRVFSYSDSLLALYRLISKKSLLLTFISNIRILPDSSYFLFETSKLILPMKTIATPQELLWPCVMDNYIKDKILF